MTRLKEGWCCTLKKFCIEIYGNVDGLLLWNLIEKYKVNLTTDCENKTWVYGEANEGDIGKIVSICSLFGESLKIELSKAKGVE